MLFQFFSKDDNLHGSDGNEEEKQIRRIERREVALFAPIC